jgi:hypothetical protein
MQTLLFTAQIIGLITLFLLAGFGLVTLILTVYDKPWSGPWGSEAHTRNESTYADTSNRCTGHRPARDDRRRCRYRGAGSDASQDLLR